MTILLKVEVDIMKAGHSGVRVRDQPEGRAGVEAGAQDQGDQHHAHQPQQRQVYLRQVLRSVLCDFSFQMLRIF